MILDFLSYNPASPRNWTWEVERDKNLDFQTRSRNMSFDYSLYLKPREKTQNIVDKTLLIARNVQSIETIKELFIKKISDKTIKINWNPVLGAKKYQILIQQYLSENLKYTNFEFLTSNTNFQFEQNLLTESDQYQIIILAMHTDNPGSTLESQDQMRFSESTSQTFTRESLTELHRNIMCQDPC